MDFCRLEIFPKSVGSRALFCTAGLLLLLLNLFPYAGLPVFGPGAAYALHSDLNHDGQVDLEDVKLFSRIKLKADRQNADLCQLAQNGYKQKQHLGQLYAYILNNLCGPPENPPENPLAVLHGNDLPVRLAFGPWGDVYVTDSKWGSVFIYDQTLTLTGELKGLVRPLGVAVDSQGNVYVGDDGTDSVEVFSPEGTKMATWGAGRISTPTDMALDREDRLYVVDSLTNLVWVFNPDGTRTGLMGSGLLNFPVAITIAYRLDAQGGERGEVFVADQRNYDVKVFDLAGNFLRSFGGQFSWTNTGMGGGTAEPQWDPQGRFVTLQSLAVDWDDRVHVLDAYLHCIQILNPDTGLFLGSYGTQGAGPGQLNLPLDMAISPYGEVVVTNANNGRVDIVYTLP